MHVSVKRTGGYAGFDDNIGPVDTTQLDAATAQAVDRLVKQSRFFDLPATAAGGGPGADFIHYEITVADGQRRHTVAFDDDGSPALNALRDLANTVAAAAGGQG